MNALCVGAAARKPRLDDDQVGAKGSDGRHRPVLPGMPARVAGDDDDAATRVLLEECGEIAGSFAELNHDCVGEDVRGAVQGFARSDVRLRHELEDEDRAGDRGIAVDLERTARSFAAD